MFEELDKVVLTHDIKEANLKKGDKGTIVHVYGKGEGYEVEFFDLKGKTLAVLTLLVQDIRTAKSLFSGITMPNYFSSASDREFIIESQNVLGGLDTVFDINELEIREISKSKDTETLERFHYPTL